MDNDDTSVDARSPTDIAIDSVFLSASKAMSFCRARTPGDGTMHVARKILTDAIDEFDRAIRQ